MSQEILVSPREAIQTPPLLPLDGAKGLGDPFLPPPNELIETAMFSVLKELVNDKNLMVELPNPISCPSSAKMVQRLLTAADALDIAGRVPVHIRMKQEDMRLAIAAGAKAVHLYANSSELAKKAKPIDFLLSEMGTLADMAYKNRLTYLRASLEQATSTKEEKILEFVRGLKKINDSFQKQVITSLGLPDTNGMAIPEDYRRILSGDILKAVKEANLTLFIHLHDDGGHALENVKTIREITKDEEIPVVIETVPDDYPGERVGIRPLISELNSLGFASLKPIYSTTNRGSTWISDRQYLENTVKKSGTAGVHTDELEKYGNGLKDLFPSPGVYTIMGARNFKYLQEHILELGVDDDDDRGILKGAALIGREMAAQYGNQMQAVALALAEIAYKNPEIILNMANRFNNPALWLVQEIPDLRRVCDLVSETARTKWGIIINFNSQRIKLI